MTKRLAREMKELIPTKESSRSERRAFCKWDWRRTDKTHGLNYAEFWQEYGVLRD